VLIRRALVAGCAVAVVAGGCSSGSGKAGPTTTAEAPASTTTRAPATTSTTTIPIPGPPLEPLILKNAPSGFPRKPDSLADTGPTDLEKAVIDDALSDEREARRALKSAGFRRGYQRQWSTENGVGQNFVYVYQFATPAGAISYLSHWRASVIAGAARAAPVPFTSSVPGAIGLQGNDARGSSGVVLFAKGPYAVQAVSTDGPRIDESTPTTALAFAQYALLP
jgi:hypothetical protein